MIVVDSSVWIDFLNGRDVPHVRRLRAIFGVEELIVGDLMLCEVLQGLDSERDARMVEALLRRFEIVPMAGEVVAIAGVVPVIAAGNDREDFGLGTTGSPGAAPDAIAVAAARNFRSLRRRGITIRKTIDLLIGTWCIENRRPLLHNDNDFRPMARHLGLIEVALVA